MQSLLTDSEPNKQPSAPSPSLFCKVTAAVYIGVFLLVLVFVHYKVSFGSKEYKYQLAEEAAKHIDVEGERYLDAVDIEKKIHHLLPFFWFSPRFKIFIDRKTDDEVEFTMVMKSKPATKTSIRRPL
ncbi:hypothetical protein P9112_009712 [Eukaryota sp. TZLM1-RC]